MAHQWSGLTFDGQEDALTDTLTLVVGGGAGVGAGPLPGQVLKRQTLVDHNDLVRLAVVQ